MKTIELRVDGMPAPLGLDHGSPSFSWIPVEAGRDSAQQAYRIVVAESAKELARDGEEIWDSGRVESPATFGIRYEGKPLGSARSYWWKVCLWNREGACGPWSAPARFGTGMLSPSDWKAHWIGRGPFKEPHLDFDTIKTPDDAEEQHGFIPVETESALLRKEFALDKPVRSATVYVCGLGFYYLHLNGQRIGEDVHTPSKTDYRQQVLYDAYDVTDKLSQGKNAIGLVLGNGWYNPGKTWWDWHMQWHGSKRAFVQMHILFADGTETRVVSDTSWKTALGPIREHCLYDGELYDARHECCGWDTAVFDDAGWTAANAVEAPGGDLRYHDIEPVRVTETIRPKTQWEVVPGTYIFDMGQNFSGVVRLRVSGPRGAEVTIRHAENIFPDGSLNMATNNRAKNLDRYILKGDGVEIFKPAFVYHGFRYVQVCGYPGAPTLDDVLGIVLHTASPQTGEFHCANELINHIHRCTVWSQRSNMMGLPTDDNQRDERLGWMADAHLAAEQCMHNFEPWRFYRKWLRDIKYAQHPQTGSIPYIVPRPCFTPVGTTPAWSSAYPLVVWYLYTFTGCRTILEEHFAPICRYVDFLTTCATGHILPKDRYGDHLSIADGRYRGDPLLSSTWYYHYDAMLASRMAGVLGKSVEEKRYADLAEAIRDAFNVAFFNSDKHVYGSGTHCEQIMPLWTEMQSGTERNNLVDRLIYSIMEMNHAHLRVGILGAKYAWDLLMYENRNDVIWACAMKEDYPSLGYMTKGYTTLSETWNRTGTNNHVMWGHIDTWFYQGLCGIRPVTAGYGEIAIQPYIPSDLAWARGAIHTLRGRIAAGWRRKGNGLVLDVTIPANTVAHVRLPAGQLHDQCIMEGGKTVWCDGFVPGVRGVRSGTRQGSWVALTIGSGSYSFSFEWRATYDGYD